MKTIDLRSDTVTRPTQAMRAAMADAVVGDDVFGDDPTVNQLQARSAEMLGTEAALFVPSGTQCNLVALLSHCERGDEYIVGQQAHTYKLEGGGAAVLGSIQPQPLEFESDGSLNLDNVASAIKPDDNHFARTRLLCLENTQGGKVLPLKYIEQASAFAKRHGLGLHLDGARVFNAAVKLDIPVHDIAQHVDSVAFCLSKGLGAPVGSVLCGTEALIKRAHRWRKVLGGGMRQAGILAAAGLVALNDHVERLAEDHANARQLADGLASVDELEVDPQEVQTNMVFVSMNQSHCHPLAKFLRQHGILIASGKTTRLVTHLDVTTDDVQSVVKRFKDFFARGQ
jgi:threonine aldolase